MWKKTLMLCIAATLLMVATAVSAGPARRAEYVTKKTITLEGSEIEGSLLGPSGGWVSGHEKVVFRSLIDYRLDFVPEIVREAEVL